MDYLACGLNTCRLAAKFARLFAGVNIILVPDRDDAAEKGSQHSSRVLRGVAKSIRVAVLPAEFNCLWADGSRQISSTGRSDLIWPGSHG